MTSFLALAAGFVMSMVALGMVRIVQGPAPADRMMSAQLLGTGGIAALVLSSVATDTPSLVDVAFAIALLAAFAAVAFVTASEPKSDDTEATDK